MGDFDSKKIHLLEEHVHVVQKIAPTGVDPVTLTGGAQWTLGVYGNDLLAANAATRPFDLHHVVVSDPDTNEDYEIVFFGGDTEIGRIAFTRTGVFVGSIQIPIITPVQDAGTQIRAKVMDGGAGGGAICKVKVAYHEY